MGHPMGDALTKTAYDTFLCQKVPIAGGLFLSATLYLPRGAKPSPALVTFTPYGTDFAHPWASRNAEHGYPVVVIDVLGRGNSDGKIDMFGPYELDACLKALAWVRAQTWCTGDYGLYGGSYAGILQWRIAASAPEGLKALAPTVAPMPGLDDGTSDGAPWTYWLRWGAYVQGRGTQHKLFADDSFWRQLFFDHWQSGDDYAALGQGLGVDITTFATMMSKALSAPLMADSLNLKAIACPVLTLTGTADDAGRGAVAWHEAYVASGGAYAAESRLVIGPWDHSGQRMPPKFAGEPQAADPLIDSDPIGWSDDLTLSWFDHWLKSKPLPQSLTSAVCVFVQGTEQWTKAARLQDLEHNKLILCPHADHLSPTPAESQTLSFVSDPWDTRLVAREATGEVVPLWRSLSGAVPLDTGFSEGLDKDEGHLFWSAPMDAPVKLIGPPNISLCLSLDQPSADIAAFVLAWLPDGQKLTLCGSFLRLKTDIIGEPQTISLPKPGFIARTLPMGARLGLVVRSGISIAFQRGLNAHSDPMTTSIPADAPPTRITLYCGGQAETQLTLALGTS
jgi:uncharacterized protein